MDLCPRALLIVGPERRNRSENPLSWWTRARTVGRPIHCVPHGRRSLALIRAAAGGLLDGDGARDYVRWRVAVTTRQGGATSVPELKALGGAAHRLGGNAHARSMLSAK